MQQWNTDYLNWVCSPVATGTPSGGQFGWGGTPPIRKQRRPKVSSGGTEILRRVQGHKLALLWIRKFYPLLRKQGLAIHRVLRSGARWWQKSYLRGNRVVAG